MAGQTCEVSTAKAKEKESIPRSAAALPARASNAMLVSFDVVENTEDVVKKYISCILNGDCSTEKDLFKLRACIDCIGWVLLLPMGIMLF